VLRRGRVGSFVFNPTVVPDRARVAVVKAVGVPFPDEELEEVFRDLADDLSGGVAVEVALFLLREHAKDQPASISATAVPTTDSMTGVADKDARLELWERISDKECGRDTAALCHRVSSLREWEVTAGTVKPQDKAARVPPKGCAGIPTCKGSPSSQQASTPPREHGAGGKKTFRKDS
ncbi:unnamed protein product, partial [Discosporangium mesarthrocarpum]